MKTKNSILAMVAFAFAIGSAVASHFAAEDVWVKAKLSSSGTAPTQCVNTNQQCNYDALGTKVCSVTVPTSINSGTTTASTSGSIFAYRSGCATVIKVASDEPHTSTVTGIYRLVEN